MQQLLLRFVVVGVLCCGVFGAQRTEAATGVISVNFHEFDGLVNLIDGEETYGVPSEGSVVGGWINLKGGISPVSVGGPAYSDWPLSTGAASTVDVVGANNPGGQATFFNAALDNTPMRAAQMDFGGSGTSPFVDLGGLSATFSSYKVIAYLTGFNGFAGGNRGSIRLVSPLDGSPLPGDSGPYYWQVANPYDGTLLQTTDTDPNDGIPLATYAVFDNRTEDSISIEWSTLGGGIGLGGFQIVGELLFAPENADFNGNSLVDGGDFLIWQRNVGGPGTQSDGDANSDGNVDDVDLGVWQSQFGSDPSGLASVAAVVPEPATSMLIFAAAVVGLSALVRGRVARAA